LGKDVGGGIAISYAGILVVLYVVYRTLTYARRVLKEGNPLGAIGIGALCVLATGLAVYQLFIR
jgi:hypothetical protein